MSDVLSLARRFEPVLRFTQGELFFPMAVEDYLASSALFRRVPGKKVPELVTSATQLDLSTLISYAARLILSFTLSRNRSIGRLTAGGAGVRTGHDSRVAALSRGSACSAASSTRSCDCR